MEPDLESELEQLNQRLLLMASRTEHAVRLACRALVGRDEKLAGQVEAQDSRIDSLEMQIDELAIRLLSLSPRSRDLRFVAVAMKIGTDLERIGDEATTMARRCRMLNQWAPLEKTGEIPGMTSLALAMVDQALNAFIHSDAALAREVVPQDREVDRRNQELHDDLFDQMSLHRDRIHPCHHLMVVSKCIERIADHAKNIAELVVYLNEAVDIRHHGSGSPPGADG